MRIRLYILFLLALANLAISLLSIQQHRIIRNSSEVLSQLGRTVDQLKAKASQLEQQEERLEQLCNAGKQREH